MLATDYPVDEKFYLTFDVIISIIVTSSSIIGGRKVLKFHTISHFVLFIELIFLVLCDREGVFFAI